MVAGLILAVDLLSGCAPTAGTVSPAVPPELKHSWETAFNRGDIESVVALYADDADLVMPGAEPVHGRTAIRAAVADMIKSGVRVKIDTMRNIGSGAVAYVYGPYQVTDAGGHVVEHGRYVETWEKRAAGWQIVVDINTAAPADAGAPAGGASPPDAPAPRQP